ncbi:unnamed protein product [Orchesella dallaii]|uniref:C2H2-type domain-containing protein n=1 Tax=Orchesella dallaii TaxID=48710 RepID=A0ABP1QYJ6_9HEXA
MASTKTCFSCRVEFNSPFEQPNGNALKSAILWNMIEEMNVGDIGLGGQDSSLEDIFPMCVLCERQLWPLWEYKESKIELEKKRTQAISAILQNVADGELLKVPIPNRGVTSANAANELREILLERYRQTRITQKLKEMKAITTQESLDSSSVPGGSNTMRNEHQRDNGNPTRPSFEAFNYALVPTTAVRASSSSVSSNISNAAQESSSTSTSTNQAEGSNSSQPLPLATVKEEAHTEWSGSNTEDDGNPLCFNPESKSNFLRKYSHNGIDIYKGVGPTNKQFLMCSRCNFSLKLQSNYTLKFKEMHEHISTLHIDEVPAPVPDEVLENNDAKVAPRFRKRGVSEDNQGETAKLVQCNECDMKFAKKAYMGMHLKMHKRIAKEQQQRLQGPKLVIVSVTGALTQTVNAAAEIGGPPVDDEQVASCSKTVTHPSMESSVQEEDADMPSLEAEMNL